jgi:hypothetical protein
VPGKSFASNQELKQKLDAATMDVIAVSVFA